MHIALLLAVIIVNSPAVQTAEEVCVAHVKVQNAGKEDDVVWAVDFSVQVEGCGWSSGRFEFEAKVVSNSGRQKLLRSETWVFNNSSEETIQHRIQLTAGEELDQDQIEIVKDSIQCTCRNRSQD